MIVTTSGELWSEHVAGRARAEKLGIAFETIARHDANLDAERVFEGAPKTLAAYRAAARWAAREYGPAYQYLVDALQ